MFHFLARRRLNVTGDKINQLESKTVVDVLLVLRRTRLTPLGVLTLMSAMIALVMFFLRSAKIGRGLLTVSALTASSPMAPTAAAPRTIALKTTVWQTPKSATIYTSFVSHIFSVLFG